MIAYRKYTLKNGLTLIYHRDKSTPVCAVSLLYKVGSRDESPHQTGLAHLFEHLMFSGSEHAPDYDIPMQNAGGENNAFTNNDHTNFYCILPTENLDTALWLESDRMANLKLNQKKLSNQISVVIEEFKETCLNESYGDAWHYISEMAYTKHPYRWPVIGLQKEHIASVTLEDAQAFYKANYNPSNAILTIAGPLPFSEIVSKVNYWFGDITDEGQNQKIYPKEDKLRGPLEKTIKADVPSDAIYLVFPMSDRQSPEYYCFDILSDILGGGRSSRLYRHLVKEKELCSYIDAYITGTEDQGLFVIEAKLNEGVAVNEVEEHLWQELHRLKSEPISKNELLKLKNKVESSIVFSEISVMQKAINLAIFESIGDADLINSEVAMYRSVQAEDLKKVAHSTFHLDNSVKLVYLKA